MGGYCEFVYLALSILRAHTCDNRLRRMLLLESPASPTSSMRLGRATLLLCVITFWLILLASTRSTTNTMIVGLIPVLGIKHHTHEDFFIVKMNNSFQFVFKVLMYILGMHILCIMLLLLVKSKSAER
jgi:hypothetical protein